MCFFVPEKGHPYPGLAMTGIVTLFKYLAKFGIKAQDPLFLLPLTNKEFLSVQFFPLTPKRLYPIQPSPKALISQLLRTIGLGRQSIVVFVI
jgi:hypothetical protein